MLSIMIVTSKTVLPSYYESASKEYIKRLKRYCTLSLQPYDESISLENLLSGYHTIQVSTKGLPKDSVEFSEHLQELSLGGSSKVAFLLDVPFDSDDSMRLSSLSLSPELSFVCMLEQLYRAFRIWNHEPYHK
ncbi:23S rRNA (pseudouridine(1915)-N(3))-methyltransferase RlmH [Proteiniclasticum ruminis]|uniref:23S rRNA (Pseudouridine1915-N3)-methyltransferase n=1 Tax=Proteiniclasticum ruminis TaxID=398199 RepID=A0A1I5AGB4_9CLOT|nr:23S rRNA (pseudouridine(1915)-N(3))-methyltransferase RlmH [Proteiniclasticum ruminis]SFN61475.1 23S rRNA (pseudouridine1915-N3)-methyltransferase [Proteiniclasticum ruminis]